MAALRCDVWKVPEAPMDYGPGRRCTMGKECLTINILGEVGKVNRFQIPYEEENGEPVVLFCPLCDNHRREHDIEPQEYQGVVVRGRGKAYKLPMLKAIRNAVGYQQKELAEKVGCHRGTIRKLEGGKLRASVGMLNRLCAVLGVTAGALRGL